jgi:hypothetical protein
MIYKSGILLCEIFIKTFPPEVQKVLLLDASSHDLTTARRVVLFEILWHERYLKRDQLIVRVDGVPGRNAFGISAVDDTFYRDMRAVKRAFLAAGYTLAYRRNKLHPGNHSVGVPIVSRLVTEELAGAAAQLDLVQMNILKKMLQAQRASLGTSISSQLEKP